MHFTVYMEDPAERAALFRMLEIWRDLTCSCVEFSSWDPEERPEPGGILFWDLDGRLPPASIDGAYALFLCSSSSSAAIASYSLHPAGFLRKPIGMEKLWAALHRCIKLWWDSLERLEITSDRCRVRLAVSRGQPDKFSQNTGTGFPGKRRPAVQLQLHRFVWPQVFVLHDVQARKAFLRVAQKIRCRKGLFQTLPYIHMLGNFIRQIPRLGQFGGGAEHTKA